jgi:iron complex outermembrane receptor protein
MNKLFLGVSALALISSAGTAFAQTADTSQEVIVTGTRTVGVKAADSAAPIELVGNAALQRTGATSLSDSLLAAVPSLNVDHNAGDAAAVLSIAALRGVSPNDTLVLVDGKRRHSTADLYVDGGSAYSGAATVDLSFIPVGAIDHVEVLTDGAAAQYGTDAIAGVVNIILKKSASAGVASLSGGQYYEGDGNTGSWYINKGIPLTDKGFLNVTLEEQYHGFSTQGVGDRRLQDPSGAPLAGDTAFQVAGIKAADNYPSENRLNGDPTYNLYNGFWNAGYDITPDLQFYAFGNYGQRVSSHFENYRVPTKVSGCLGAVLKSDGTCSDGSANYYPLPNGFDPREKFNETDYSFTEGFKGTLAGWHWDLSNTYGRDNVQVSTINSANAQLYPVLQSLSATPIAPQRNFYDGGYINSEMTNTLDIDRSFPMSWAASPLNVALGAEQRHDTYSIQNGEPPSYYGAGAQSFDGYLPQDAGTHGRTNYAFYADLAIDPITHLHTDFAVRYEHYSDFGSTVVGKVTARYDFNPMIAVRGTASTGFRAPTLAEEYYSGTNVSPTSADVQLPPNSSAATFAGFGALKPEQSDNYSLGVVLHPIPRLQITADAYSILIKDRILVSGFLFGEEAGCTAAKPSVGCTATQYSPDTVSAGVLQAIQNRGVQLDNGLSYAGISIFANAANTRTDGLEATATYSSDFGEYGHVDWSLGFNYNKTDITKLDALPSAVANVAFGQTALLNAAALSGLTDSTPREKAILQAYWTFHQWSVNLRETIYGSSSEMTSFNGSGEGLYAFKETIPATGITDIEIAYRVTPQIKLSIGANNLFNQFPPTTPNHLQGTTLEPVNGALVWNVPYNFSPYGINGGYYYGRATFTF